jgi:hypothetical protein
MLQKGISLFKKIPDNLHKYRIYVIILLIIYSSIGIKYLSLTVLLILNHILMRAFVAVVVAFLAYKDPVLAVILTLSYVLTLRELKLRFLNTVNNEIVNFSITLTNMLNNIKNSLGYKTPLPNTEDNIETKKVFKYNIKDNDNKIVYGKSHLEHIPFEPQHPSSRTLSENIQLGDPEWRQLTAIQTNNVDGVNSANLSLVGGFDKDTTFCKF